MSRFPISRVDHVRALPDRRLVVRAPCPMCGRPQLELPIGPNTKCRDCGVGLRYVSNHLVPEPFRPTSTSGIGQKKLHPPAVGNGGTDKTRGASRRLAPEGPADGENSNRERDPAGGKAPPKGSGVNGDSVTRDPGAAELDWIFAPGADDDRQKNGVSIPERLTDATTAEFARTIA